MGWGANCFRKQSVPGIKMFLGAKCVKKQSVPQPTMHSSPPFNVSTEPHLLVQSGFVQIIGKIKLSWIIHGYSSLFSWLFDVFVLELSLNTMVGIFELCSQKFEIQEKTIKSNDETTITDKDNNTIFLENFDYLANNSIFKSVGIIKINDLNNNTYEFSQIYIDTKKKEILGTDIKAYLNSKEFKIHPENQPRIFANTVSLERNERTFVFIQQRTLLRFCSSEHWTVNSNQVEHLFQGAKILFNM